MRLAKVSSAAITFLRSLRGSWYFGGATRNRSPEAALAGHAKALATIDHHWQVRVIQSAIAMSGRASRARRC